MIQIVNQKGEIALDVYEGRPKAKYILYNNKHLIRKSKHDDSYLELWEPLLRKALSPHGNRVLILGGGDQLLVKHLRPFYCDITLVDPLAYHYFNSEVKKLLGIEEYYAEEHKKFVPLDMSFKEAYEDVLEGQEFDLIIVDNFQEDLEYTTGMYEKDVPALYYKLLKQGGHLCINHRFGVPKHIDKKYKKDDPLRPLAKTLRAYYDSYLEQLNSYLEFEAEECKGVVCVSLYCKKLSTPSSP